MNEKLKQLLKKLGVESETITALENDDADALKNFDPEAAATSIREATATALKNDSGFMDGLEKSIRGKVLSSKERKLMKLFNISKEEYDALPEATKFDSLMELANEKAEASSGATDEKLKGDLKTAREEIIKLNDKVSNYEEKVIPELKNQTALERDNMQLETLARKTLQKESLAVDPDFAYGSLMGTLQKKYDVKLNESKDSLTLQQKGKELDVIVDNKPLTFEAALKAEIEAAGIGKKSNAKGDGARGKGAGGADDDDPGADKKFKFAGSSKAEQRAAELAARAKGGDAE
jgi:hypothetical protein